MTDDDIIFSIQSIQPYKPSNCLAGYNYAKDIALYYLQSRYYDPEVGRFINADNAAYLGANDSLTSYNLFAYCSNNPVNLTDSVGTLPSWVGIIAGVAVGLVVAAVVVSVAPAAMCAASLALELYGLSSSVSAALVSVGTAVFAANATMYGMDLGYSVATGESPVLGMMGNDTELYGSWKLATEISFIGYASAVNASGTLGVCFIAGTLVWTETCQKAIEEIKVGDKVYAWNEETGQTELKTVVETYENETTELTHVFAGGEEIISTPSHPFYSPVKGWTAACRLKAGDILVTVNGEYVVVEQVQHELLENPVKVYNFQVEDDHTYYVSGTGVLVHNDCHGNSLNSTRTNYGYELQDEHGNIIKYGETLHPNTRYSQTWLSKNNYTMKIMVEGSKEYVHQWQHQKILDYVYISGQRPILNKSLW